MVSNKLSSRRSAAKRPPICLSIPPIIIPSTDRIYLAVIWTSTDPGYPILNVTDTILLQRAFPGSDQFFHGPIAPTPNRIWYAYATLPWMPPFNQIQIQATDPDGNNRTADNFFEPERPPPFDQEVNAGWSTAPTTDTVYAHFYP